VLIDAGSNDATATLFVDMDAGVLPGFPDAGTTDASVMEAVQVASGTPERPSCRPRLVGRLRDFEDWHPDFAAADAGSLSPGAVQEKLGVDGSPVYAPAEGGAAIAARPDTFTDWFHDRDEINLPRDFTLELQESEDGVHFRDSSFFPLDDSSASHNHYFTYQLRGVFDYRGGEAIKITADDDLWAFVNGHLIIDLGGVHSPITQVVQLDREAARIQLRVGNSYRLDIFAAQRRSPTSVLGIDASLQCIRPEGLSDGGGR
jgi:fibro-slime domain-containing protein